MFSLFGSRKGAKPIDDYLARYLTATYQMSDEETGKLHFVTTTESLASQKVTLFRIFEPSGSSADQDKVSYESLDADSPSIKFEGRFAKNKTVTEIRDLRSAE